MANITKVQPHVMFAFFVLHLFSVLNIFLQNLFSALNIFLENLFSVLNISKQTV